MGGNGVKTCDNGLGRGLILYSGYVPCRRPLFGCVLSCFSTPLFSEVPLLCERRHRCCTTVSLHVLLLLFFGLFSCFLLLIVFIPRVKNKKLIKSGNLLVRTVRGERVVQKHRNETLNKNRDAPETE